ncbi:patatin-like phospholipase family protein [Algoriphagus hitonicola]|uniref:Patatin-like phospholipase n=1 Tax=Algoriphagus hitonicola TaxID=435880 RepID=A0A1I2XXD4_9BACT|nr:patatin-like phospholipase family protein [Algoriphagus hitonicola]SFH16741.1 Patatin-like phospholipase [Algoriphagus hitonicola]
MKQSENFHLGLCLAGAISAGAYTAGVLDFLIEALDEWEKRKKKGDPKSVPQHQVKLSVIGGASAGGMTGMISAFSLQKEFDPVHLSQPDLYQPRPDNPLYQAWVDQLEEELSPGQLSMFDLLLDPGDLDKNMAQSLLNSTFVRKIADKILDAQVETSISRGFVADELKIFSTLTNLKGLEYSLDFKGDKLENDPYRIYDHRDFACFSLGSRVFPGWERMDFTHPEMLERYKLAAIGTGAFPIGLSPVKMARNGKLMQELPWLSHVSAGGGNRFPTDWYESTFVDGGMMNNEPFEKVRDALLQLLGYEKEHSVQDYSKFESTVLMVDPFPSTTNFIQPGSSLLGYAGNVLSALMNQARIKPEHLINSLTSEMAGQYVISPIRYQRVNGEEKKIEGAKAIACGSLDGFGGFLSKKFRIHDFFLGRANCEKFLRDHFTVPLDEKNPIFERGYAEISAELKPHFMSTTDKKPGVQIIPLFSERKTQPEMPYWENEEQWPTLSIHELERYRPLLKKRIEQVILKSVSLNRLDYIKLWAGAKIFLNGKISSTLMQAMNHSLNGHKQLN